MHCGFYGLAENYKPTHYENLIEIEISSYHRVPDTVSKFGVIRYIAKLHQFFLCKRRDVGIVLLENSTYQVG